MRSSGQPDPFRTPYSTTAKIGVALLVLGTCADAFGVSSFSDMKHSSGQGGFAYGIFGMGCFLAGAVAFVIGALVAGVASRWRRGGERRVALLCLAAFLVGAMVGMAMFTA